jgi:methionine-rich copper-binding protein CopC
MRRFALVAAIALTALNALPGMAQAHPKLLAANPADKAIVAKPTRLSLSFSENLVGPMSWIELVMTGMPGMASHAPMPIKGFQTKVNGKDVTIILPRALPAGTYLLKWRAVAADQHRVEGGYSFTVR